MTAFPCPCGSEHAYTFPTPPGISFEAEIREDGTMRRRFQEHLDACPAVAQHRPAAETDPCWSLHWVHRRWAGRVRVVHGPHAPGPWTTVEAVPA